MSRRKVYVTAPDGTKLYRTTDRKYQFAVLVATDAATELAHEQAEFAKNADRYITYYEEMTPDDPQFSCAAHNAEISRKRKIEWEKKIAAMPREGTTWESVSWHGTIEQARKGKAKIEQWAAAYRVVEIIIQAVDPE